MVWADSQHHFLLYEQRVRPRRKVTMTIPVTEEGVRCHSCPLATIALEVEWQQISITVQEIATITGTFKNYRMILIPFAVVLTLISTEDVLPSSFVPPCPPGWSQFLDSCYQIENGTMSLPKAEKRCAAKGATLFVANSLEEFNNVTRLAPRNRLSWIGLAQFDGRSSPIWQTTSGIEPSSLNQWTYRKWLVTPFSSVANGWSIASRCAAHYNSDVESAKYTYFYPCESLFSSICENNFTFNSALAHQFNQL